jgi:hypothetical protein
MVRWTTHEGTWQVIEIDGPRARLEPISDTRVESSYVRWAYLADLVACPEA